MARKPEPKDDQLKALIAEALGPHLDGAAEETSAVLVEAVMARLKPVIGAAAERRRNQSLLREAFREGFRTGQSQGRFARWHSLLWTHSAMARRLRETSTGATVAQQSRYAAYNYDS